MGHLRGTMKEQQVGASTNDSNRIPNRLKNSWWTAGLDNWVVNAGQVTIMEDDKGYLNLTMDTTTSSQVKQVVNLKANHCYFVMFDVQVTRYTKGLFGVYFTGKFTSGNPDMGLRRLSKGYETITGILKTPDNLNHPQVLFVGSIGGADGAGSIRRLSLFDLTDLYGVENEPNVNEFYFMLPQSLNEQGAHLSLREVFTKATQYMEEPLASDEEARQVFLNEMRKKTQVLGMENTHLVNVNGFHAKGQQSTSRDLLKLLLHATGYKKLLAIWGKKKHRAFIQGGTPREIEVISTVQDEKLEKTYTILGGKTGALATNILNVVALLSDSEGQLYLAVVLGASGKTGNTDRYEAMKLLVDTAKQRKTNPDYQPTESYKARAGSVMAYPIGEPHFYTYSPPDSMYGVNETESIPPASVIKVINALVVLDTIHNLHETFEIKKSDILGGSGPLLYEGDIISFWDALHFSLLPSSNTIAKAFSRIIGHKIIQARGYIE